MTISAEEFEFVVLPGNLNKPRNLAPYYAAAYCHWKKVWQRVFLHIAGEGTFNPDDYLKQSNIFSIFHKGEVVSQICSRILHADNEVTIDIPYFQEIGEFVFSDLSAHKSKRIMTLEYNALNPKYSRRRSGFPFAEALLYLCFEAARSLEIDCCTAVPRKITRAQDTLTEMNFRKLRENLTRHNCPIDVMVGYLEELAPPKEVAVAEFVASLWLRRIDHNVPENLGIKNKSTQGPSVQNLRALTN